MYRRINNFKEAHRIDVEATRQQTQAGCYLPFPYLVISSFPVLFSGSGVNWAKRQY
jgi:hypothetical protein